MYETYSEPDLGAAPGPVDLGEIQTPFALIDGQVLHRNIAKMQEAVVSLGASLRPHFKTHRTLAIARLQRDAGAIGLTVATTAQLRRVQRDIGCPVLASSPLQVDHSATEALRAACTDGDVIFSIESERSIDLLRAALGPDVSAKLMIEVDSGCLRCGVSASDCGALARAAAKLGFHVVGLFSYPGHGYLPGNGEQASREERGALETGALALRRAGFEPEHISAGSTPTMSFAMPGIATEYRPGTYIFGDRQQHGLGAVERSQLSLSIVATVTAVHGDRLVLDAGGKALGRDAPRWLSGYGELAGEPRTQIARLYDHHSVIEGYRGPAVSVGDRLAVIPNNSNSAMALLRSAWLTEDGRHAHELAVHADR